MSQSIPHLADRETSHSHFYPSVRSFAVTSHHTVRQLAERTDMFPRLRNTLYFCLCLSFSVPSVHADVCYDSDRNIISNAQPCATTTDFTYCCDENAICMENGICLQDLFPTVGTCTDPSWHDTSCPHYCSLGGSTHRMSMITMKALTGLATESMNQTSPYKLRYCGGSNWACSSDGCADYDHWPISPNLVLRDYQVASLGLKGVVTISPTSTSASETASNTASGTVARISCPTVPTANCANASSSSPSQTVSAVGAGLGVPLGVLAILFLGLFLWERKKNQKLRSTDPNTKDPGPAPPYGHPYSPLGMNPNTETSYPAPPLEHEHPFSPSSVGSEMPHSELGDTSKPTAELGPAK